MSDWLASSIIIISNLFSAGFSVSITLFIGIIHAGTAFWQTAIFSFACFLYSAAFFPVPFPIFCIVCSHPLSAWLTSKFSFFSIKHSTWYHDFFSTSSNVTFFIFFLFSAAFFSKISYGSFSSLSSSCESCFHFHTSSISSTLSALPVFKTLCHSGAVLLIFSRIFSLFW